MTDFPEIDVYRSDLERMIVSIFNAEPVLAHPPRPGARPAPVRLHALRSFRVNAVAAPRSRALKRPPPLSDSTRAVGVAARAKRRQQIFGQHRRWPLEKNGTRGLNGTDLTPPRSNRRTLIEYKPATVDCHDETD